jgi:hypothetical protein
MHRAAPSPAGAHRPPLRPDPRPRPAPPAADAPPRLAVAACGREADPPPGSRGRQQGFLPCGWELDWPKARIYCSRGLPRFHQLRGCDHLIAPLRPLPRCLAMAWPGRGRPGVTHATRQPGAGRLQAGFGQAPHFGIPAVGDETEAFPADGANAVEQADSDVPSGLRAGTPDGIGSGLMAIGGDKARRTLAVSELTVGNGLPLRPMGWTLGNAQGRAQMVARPDHVLRKAPGGGCVGAAATEREGNSTAARTFSGLRSESNQVDPGPPAGRASTPGRTYRGRSPPDRTRGPIGRRLRAVLRW